MYLYTIIWLDQKTDLWIDYRRNLKFHREQNRTYN